MSIESLLEEQAALTNKARQEIDLLEGEIEERKEKIRTIRARFPGVKKTTPKRGPGRPSKNLNRERRHVSDATLAKTAWGVLAQPDNGVEFTVRDVKLAMGINVGIESVRDAFVILRDLEVIRLAKAQSGPHPATYTRFPNVTEEYVNTMLAQRSDNNGA